MGGVQALATTRKSVSLGSRQEGDANGGQAIEGLWCSPWCCLYGVSTSGAVHWSTRISLLGIQMPFVRKGKTVYKKVGERLVKHATYKSLAAAKRAYAFLVAKYGKHQGD